jgi:excisionase family DNA binding protein
MAQQIDSADARVSTGRLLTAEEVAEIIGMRVDYVYALSRRGQIPHLRFGRTLRFRAEAIEGWLRAGERGTLGRST